MLRSSMRARSRTTLLLICAAGILAGIWTLLPASPLSCEILGSRRSSIDEPGRYCLASDVALPGGVEIRASEVDVDLQGHCIVGTGDRKSTVSGIVVAAGLRNVSIRNGCVRGFMQGITAAAAEGVPNSSGITVDRMDLRANWFRGIRLVADDTRITRNLIQEIGGSELYSDAFAMGIEVEGDRCLIESNVVRNVYPTGSGEGIGISLSRLKFHACTVRDNTILNDRLPVTGRTFGIWAPNRSLVTGNVISTMTYGIGAALNSRKNIVIDESCSGKNYAKSSMQENQFVSTGRSSPCTDDLETALALRDLADRHTLFRLGQIYDMLESRVEALAYYRLAGRLGSFEGERVAKKFVALGFVTPEEVAAADVREREILAGADRNASGEKK